MPSTIDCDHVFDILTRGPVSLDEQPTVRDHLTECSACRELADALRPAMHLVHEALGDERLPRVEGLLFDVREVAETGRPVSSDESPQTPPQVSPSDVHRPDVQRPVYSWLPLLAAVLAWIALLGWTGPTSRSGSPGGPAQGSEAVRLPPSHPPLVASEGGTTLCCVDCHQPGNNQGKPSISMLAQSCHTCHR